MWTEDPDDRAFVRELAYQVIASVAPGELGDFDRSMAAYLAQPTPPWPRSCRQRSPWQSRLAPVAPAMITAVLNLLLIEIEDVAQYDQSEIVKRGLKRLLRRRGAHPNERLTLRSGSRLQETQLALTVYLYTLPVSIALPISRLADVAYEIANIYGLDLVRADELAAAVLARFCLGPGAPRDKEQDRSGPAGD